MTSSSPNVAPIHSHPPTHGDLNKIPPELEAKFEPTYVEYWNKYNVGRLATHQVPIADYRANPSKYITSYGRELVPDDGLKIQDLRCPVQGGEITVRVIEPEKGGDRKRAVYINIHGGGWVFGGLETDFDFCKRVVRELGVVVFDVDYRLSPEYKFPVQVEDCWTALDWIRNTKAQEYNLDLTRLSIGGCSAGGHLTAVMAHMCRDAGIPLAFQLLGVPVCELSTVFSPSGTLLPSCPYPSYTENYYTQPLPVERMEWFHRQFLGEERRGEWWTEDDWRVSPMQAKNWKGLAKALVITAEMDPLRGEGEEYARWLKEAGNEVEVHRIKGAPHIVMQLDGILEGGKEYNRIVIEALRGTLKK